MSAKVGHNPKLEEIKGIVKVSMVAASTLTMAIQLPHRGSRN